MHRTRPHELVSSTLKTFAEVIPLACQHGGIPAAARAEIEAFAGRIFESYSLLRDAFDVCLDAFEILSVHGAGAAKPLLRVPTLVAEDHGGQGPDTYGQDLFVFVWLLTLNGKDHLMAESTDKELLRMLALYCLTFAITQTASTSRRSIGDVFMRACGKKLAPGDLPDGTSPSDDWIRHSQLTRNALCLRYQLNAPRYEAVEPQFIQAFLMPHFIETPQFKYRSVVVLHESFPWPLYDGAMEPDRHSYFHVNLEHLRNRYAAGLHGKSDEVDGRVFLQNQKPNATPRRYVRSQNRSAMNSVRSSPGVKGLGQVLLKVRSGNSNLMSTSLGVRSTPGSPGPSADGDFSGLQQRLEEFLAAESFDPARSIAKFLDRLNPELAQTIVAQLVERERAVTELILRNDSDMEGFCSTSIRLFHRLMHNFLRTFDGKKRMTTMPDLLLDGQFHRALMVCAFECVRFAYKIKTPSFPDIFHLFSPRYLELYMILDLVCERETWLPWMLTKRLRQLEARILEVEIWKDQVFHDFLVACRTGQDISMEEASRTALHYSEVMKEIDAGAAIKPDDLITHMTEIMMRKIGLAAFQKLKELGSTLNLSDVMVDRIWGVLDHLFAQEDQYQLFFQRNVDVVLLCTIFAVTRVSDVYLTFNEIRTVYQQLSFHIPEALADIPVAHGRNGDIVAFYNEVYLPIAKSFIAEEVGSKRTGKTPMHHRRKQGGMAGSPMRHPLRTPAHRLHGTMTPITKKLYNFGESPYRKSSGVPFPAALQPAAQQPQTHHTKPPLHSVMNFMSVPSSSRRKLAQTTPK
ncbi:hypothetical protein DFJ74DRAFT_668307 [Hyaloraphidium curvatum]|nr:hypothetical protein DFJ74DRAFT_668307 [Hyaloraphidium curvatum]